MKAIIVFTDNTSINTLENNIPACMNKEIAYILDATCGYIVYENVNHILVKIDEFYDA